MNSRRRDHHLVPYQLELMGPKSFSLWLEKDVQDNLGINSNEVNTDIICLLKYPSKFASQNCHPNLLPSTGVCGLFVITSVSLAQSLT